VYRDLKPENILIDGFGHIKLCDFGFATKLTSDSSIGTDDGTSGDADGGGIGLKDGCGTAMYIAPEIANGFTKQSHGFPVDWWALGCILFEMITGEAPFGDSDTLSKFEIFTNITERTVRFPLLMNISLKTLLKGLLEKDANARFRWKDVQLSPWLSSIQWNDVDSKRLLPPWIPTAIQEASTENFVKWDIFFPDAVPTAQVMNYCQELLIPKPNKPIGSSHGQGSDNHIALSKGLSSRDRKASQSSLGNPNNMAGTTTGTLTRANTSSRMRQNSQILPVSDSSTTTSTLLDSNTSSKGGGGATLSRKKSTIQSSPSVSKLPTTGEGNEERRSSVAKETIPSASRKLPSSSSMNKSSKQLSTKGLSSP